VSTKDGKVIVFSKLDVDELFELIHDEDTPAALRAKAIRFLNKTMAQPE
jgi:hypothetical protein